MLAARFKRLFFSLTRLSFLWYGDVAVNPINAGSNMMTSEPLTSSYQHQLSSSDVVFSFFFNSFSFKIPPSSPTDSVSSLLELSSLRNSRLCVSHMMCGYISG